MSTGPGDAERRRASEAVAPEVDGGQVEPPEPVLARDGMPPAGTEPVAGAVPDDTDPGHTGGSDVGRRVANRIVGWATDLGAPTTLILLRHGETPGSVGKLFSGRGGHDHGLTDLGLHQVERAAAAVRARGAISAIVSSPLRRCRETAAAAARELELPVEIDDDLAESAFGEWDGLTYEQVLARWPEQLADWLGRTSVAPPGGESLDELDARVLRARDRIVTRRPGEVVLVVAHVNPIKCLVRTALDAPPYAVYRMAMSPASISEIEYYGDGTSVLRSFGVAAHLTGAISLPGG